MTDLDDRLAEAISEHGAPGASLAVLADGDIQIGTAGVLNVETDVAVTPASLFQIGSTAKVYTATAVMRLVDQDKLDLDQPILELMPEFTVADPDVTRRVTARHLLTHTSGIAGDFFEDTGRGDDAVARLVERCAELGQDVPLGSTFSYSNTGFVILGRLIEQVTGQVWETAMRELVLRPLGLRQTVLSAEEAMRFRWAYGHVGEPPVLAPVWGLPRAASPAGATMMASAADLVRFGVFFLDRGRASDGSQALTEHLVQEMLRPQVTVADRWSSGDHRGLGWMLHDRGGRTVFAHGGATVGQRAFLDVVPDRRVVVALLVNGGRSAKLGRNLIGQLLRELAGLEDLPEPQPAAESVEQAPDDLLGHYERFGLHTDIEFHDGRLVGVDRPVEPLASQIPDPSPVRFSICPSTAGPGVYVARDDGGSDWRPLVPFEIDGERFVHLGGRAARQVSASTDDVRS